jgi:hypothetical protein
MFKVKFMDGGFSITGDGTGKVHLALAIRILRREGVPESEIAKRLGFEVA